VENVNLQGLQQVMQQLVGIVAGQQQGNQTHENFEGQQEVRQVDQVAAAPTRRIEVTLAEFMKLKPPTFFGSSASEDPQRFIDGLGSSSSCTVHDFEFWVVTKLVSEPSCRS
jgi:hypothetical protein